jgi:hypothetical protein
MHRSTATIRIDSSAGPSTLTSEGVQTSEPLPPRSTRSPRIASRDGEVLACDDDTEPVVAPVDDQKNALSRQHDRMRTNLRAVVYAGTTFQSTVIRDISFGGVGLSGAAGLFPGESVKITLLNGQSRSGIVRWWLSGCCGVQFQKPLTSDDPFFEAALRRAAGARA